MLSALNAAKTPLDFYVANDLAAFGVTSYAGESLVAFLEGYAKVPGYALSGSQIASAMVWLNDDMLVSEPEIVSFLEGLQNDSQIDLGTKLYIEENLYEAMAIE